PLARPARRRLAARRARRLPARGRRPLGAPLRLADLADTPQRAPAAAHHPRRAADPRPARPLARAGRAAARRHPRLARLRRRDARRRRPARRPAPPRRRPGRRVPRRRALAARVGFSTPLRETGWGHARIARAWAELMTRLGYQRFGAMGGDTGSIVSPELGRLAPDRVVGVHVHGGLARPALQPEDVAALTRASASASRSPSGSGATAPPTRRSRGPAPTRSRPRSPTHRSGCSPGCSRSSGTGPTRPRRSRTTPWTSTTCSPTSPSTGPPAAPARPPS